MLLLQDRTSINETLRGGRYVLIQDGRVVLDERMARPQGGKVADNGNFILNDWGASDALSGTFHAFAPNGGNIVSRGFSANLLNNRSEEHTSELQSLMLISSAAFCLKKKHT